MKNIRVILRVSGGIEEAKDWLREAGLQLERLSFTVENPTKPNLVSVFGVERKDVLSIQNFKMKDGREVFST